MVLDIVLKQVLWLLEFEEQVVEWLSTNCKVGLITVGN